jgi:hypothetical protein
LQAYEKATGIRLAEHPLAVRLQSCNSIESIAALLHQDEARAFSEFRGSDRVTKSIFRTVSILIGLSTTAHLGDDIGLVRQKVLMKCFTTHGFSTAFLTCESNTSCLCDPT